VTTSKRLTIFEGPDGSGKTTLAKLYASATGARYVHCGPFLRVQHGLGRLYVEAMLPALLGHHDVVLDRAWMSEPIYGKVFRDGTRLSEVDRRMLDRVAMRCETRFIVALPPVEVCLKAFLSRPADEYLKKESQLRKVHAAYSAAVDLRTLSALPTGVYDYTSYGTPDAALELVTSVTPSPAHPLSALTAGRLDAKVVLVGESFADHKEHDPLYQLPFVSFSDAGCSAWLTEKVAKAGINERQVLWANADMDRLDGILALHPRKKIIALGAKAFKNLRYGLDKMYDVVEVEHPQSAKRFHSKKPYSLIKLLKETIP